MANRFGTLPRSRESRETPWQGYWAETFGNDSVSGWMSTAKGVNTAFKVGYHVADWSKHVANVLDCGPLPPEVARFGGAMRDSKNVFAFVELPVVITKAARSCLAFLHGPVQFRSDRPQQDREIRNGARELVYRIGRNGNVRNAAGELLYEIGPDGAVFDDVREPIYQANYRSLAYQAVMGVGGVFSPIEDSLRFLNGRVAPLVSPSNMAILGNWSTGSLLLSMSANATKDLKAIWQAVKVLHPNARPVMERAGNVLQVAEDMVWGERDLRLARERLGEAPVELEPDQARLDAQVVLELCLLDLAKCVSYIALAVIALISTFIVAIPHTSFWILVTSTTALVFSILGEFALRGRRNANQAYPNLPGLGQINVIRLPEYRAMMRRGGGGDAESLAQHGALIAPSAPPPQDGDDSPPEEEEPEVQNPPAHPRDVEVPGAAAEGGEGDEGDESEGEAPDSPLNDAPAQL